MIQFLSKQGEFVLEQLETMNNDVAISLKQTNTTQSISTLNDYVHKLTISKVNFR